MSHVPENFKGFYKYHDFAKYQLSEVLLARPNKASRERGVSPAQKEKFMSGSFLLRWVIDVDLTESVNLLRHNLCSDPRPEI